MNRAIFLAFMWLYWLPLALSAGSQQQDAADFAAIDPCAALPPATDPDFEIRLEAFMNNFCYRGWQHDAQVRTSDGVHPFVKVYYSPSMFSWMTFGGRLGEVPDAAMLVKEQYQGPTAPLTEWTIMVKDSQGSYDGWYWADLSVPTPIQRPNPRTSSGEVPPGIPVS